MAVAGAGIGPRGRLGPDCNPGLGAGLVVRFRTVRSRTAWPPPKSADTTPSAVSTTCETDDWFTDLEVWGVQGLTTDDPNLRDTGLDRWQCTVHLRRIVGRHLRRINDDPAHLERVLLPIQQRLAWARPPAAEPVPPACGRRWLWAACA